MRWGLWWLGMGLIQRVVKQENQLQNTSEALFLLVLDPSNGPLPTCVLPEQNPKCKGCTLSRFTVGVRCARGSFRRRCEGPCDGKSFGELHFVQHLFCFHQKISQAFEGLSVTCVRIIESALQYTVFIRINANKCCSVFFAPHFWHSFSHLSLHSFTNISVFPILSFRSYKTS